MASGTKFENAIFRYRSIDALLGERNELDRQTVYFAPPEYLNDPMEGLRQVYWRGDRITWRNLMRHYIICLHNRCIEAFLTKDTERLSPKTISVFQSLDNFPTPKARSLCEACIASVEASETHSVMLDILASSGRDVSFLELRQLFRVVHLDWLATIYLAFSDQGLARPWVGQRPDPTGLVNSLRKLKNIIPQIKKQYPENIINIINETQRSMVDGIELLSAFRHEGALDPKRESLCFDFPSEYLNSIMRLVYPSWCVACFSARHDNAAMWSYYAGDHRGCCLVFRRQEVQGGSKLRLKGPNGYGEGRLFQESQDMSLDPVRYAAHDQQIEFFTNIGRLALEPTLRNWFRDDEGNESPLANHLSEERRGAWRETYWKNFTPPLLCKLPDWQHEEEFRIILPDTIELHESDEGRTFTYDYDTLDGIIFGINTALSDKVRIMRILDGKLGARTVSEPFKFFQARYNPESGRIEADHLSLIKYT